MNLFKASIIITLIVVLFACNSQKVDVVNSEIIKAPLDQEKRDSIVQKFVYDCADTYNYNFPEYQVCLDSGLALDSTIAYLWQQKAMPHFKQMKYEIGMRYIDKAVKLDTARWLPYRAFIKCIFQKKYKEAIADFDECVTKYGNSYEMDHTYNFYIALSYLQLNRYQEAEKLIRSELDSAANLFGEGAEHHLDLFYYGIAIYEQQEWERAMVQFDRALRIYPNFSDAQYYKSICLNRLGRSEEGEVWALRSKENRKVGFTINEDNAIYERYPYQLY